MNTKPSRIHRFAAADELLDSLLGKGGNNLVEQYVKTHHQQIAALLAGGMSASRAAKLLAVPLSVPPRRVFGALKAAGFVTDSAAPAVTQKQAERGMAQPAPKRSGDEAVLAAAKVAPAANASPSPKHARVAQALDLPPWADGSDKRDDESDEDYALRKHLEGDPKGQGKFIGESPAERAEALLKRGKLGFGASGPTEGDRKILTALIERFGANAVERRIEIETRALPPGTKLYPSKLRDLMSGHV